MKQKFKDLTAKSWPFYITMLANLGINATRSALAKRLKDGSPEEVLTVNLADIMLQIVKFMSDAIEDNSKQVRDGLLKWLNTFMTPFLFDLFQPAVEGIKKAYNRAMVQYLSNTAEQSALFLTDEIKPDGQQISGYLKSEFQKPETKTLVIDEFGKGNLIDAGLDESLVQFLLDAVGIGWDALAGNRAAALALITVKYENDAKIITLPMRDGSIGTLTIAKAA